MVVLLFAVTQEYQLHIHFYFREYILYIILLVPSNYFCPELLCNYFCLDKMLARQLCMVQTDIKVLQCWCIWVGGFLGSFFDVCSLVSFVRQFSC